jgi:hypothetical protein
MLLVLRGKELEQGQDVCLLTELVKMSFQAAFLTAFSGMIYGRMRKGSSVILVVCENLARAAGPFFKQVFHVPTCSPTLFTAMDFLSTLSYPLCPGKKSPGGVRPLLKKVPCVLGTGVTSSLRQSPSEAQLGEQVWLQNKHLRNPRKKKL